MILTFDFIFCAIGWDDYIVAFSKTYADETEKAFRQQIFLQNQQIIRTHNSLYDQGSATYSLAFNNFGDWTKLEYLEIMGFFPSQATEDDLEEVALHSVRRRSPSPDSKDWRNDGAVTPVKVYDCTDDSRFYLRTPLLH